VTVLFALCLTFSIPASAEPVSKQLGTRDRDARGHPRHESTGSSPLIGNDSTTSTPLPNQKCPQAGPASCPGLLFPLGPKGGYNFSEPDVAFDWDADGTPELVSWPENPEKLAFLVFDRDGNGTIDNGRELFGNHTLEGVDNGFDALKYSNDALNGEEYQSGFVDGASPIFSHLRLWTDVNRKASRSPKNCCRSPGALQPLV